MGYTMKGSPAKMGGIQGTSSHASALKQQEIKKLIEKGKEIYEKSTFGGGEGLESQPIWESVPSSSEGITGKGRGEGTKTTSKGGEWLKGPKKKPADLPEKVKKRAKKVNPKQQYFKKQGEYLKGLSKTSEQPKGPKTGTLKKILGEVTKEVKKKKTLSFKRPWGND